MFRRTLRWTAVIAALAGAYAVGTATGQPVRAPQVSASEPDRAQIEAMLRRIGDRWARFYTAEEFGGLQDSLNGYYSGVGLWLDGSGHRVSVAGEQDRSPAARAGVRVGDVITSVDGTPTTELTVASVAAALRGPPDTSVAVVLRRGGRYLRFALVWAAMATRDVSASVAPGGVLVIRVDAFTRGVGRQVREELRSHPGRSGVVLDLRGDPGGLLDEAVETASAFLSGGLVVTYEASGARPQRLDALGGGDTTTPLVVLVDGGTASAAEIVVGSLRDRDRAVIVGSRTFGKGSVQQPVKLADGSAVELTVGHYRTPGGRSVDGSGIEPDVAVAPDRPPREAERRALTVLRGLRATLPTKDRG